MTLKFEVWVPGRMMMLLKDDICWEDRLICKGKWCLKIRNSHPHNTASGISAGWWVWFQLWKIIFSPCVKQNSKVINLHWEPADNSRAEFKECDFRDHWEKKFQSQEEDKESNFCDSNQHNRSQIGGWNQANVSCIGFGKWKNYLNWKEDW